MRAPEDFIRSMHTWRRPWVHILGDERESYVIPYCKTNAFLKRKADIYHGLPEGMEVCRACAERWAQRQERRAQRLRPDPRAYRAKTDALLGVGRSEDAGADLREAA